MTSGTALPEDIHRLAVLLKSPRPALRFPPQFVGKISEPCQAFWRSLLSIDLSSVQSLEVNEQKLPNGEHCSTLAQTFIRRHRDYLEACRQWQGDHHSDLAGIRESNASACQSAFLFYRSELTHWMTKETAVLEIKDARVLMDKLLAVYSSDYELAAEIGEQLLRINSALPTVAKATLYARFMDAQLVSGDENHPKWVQLDDALTRAQKMGVPPEDLFEVRSLGSRARWGNWKKVIEESQAFNQAHENRGEGFYFLAWAAFENGDRKEAEAYLQKAILREPDHIGYRVSADGLAKGRKQVFHANLTFPLDPVLLPVKNLHQQ